MAAGLDRLCRHPGRGGGVQRALFGRAVSRIGPANARTIALAGVLLSWALFAVWRNSLLEMAPALVLIDVCATTQDIFGRTILYSPSPEQRRRLNAVYTLPMFAGGGASSVLVGLCWANGGWLGVCGLGALAGGEGLILAACAGRPAQG